MMNQPYLERQRTLRDKLATSDFEALIIASFENCRYLSGFAIDHGNVAYLVMGQDKQYLVTDYRYAEQASAECQGFEVIVRDRQNCSLGAQFHILLQQMQVKNVGFERDFSALAWLRLWWPNLTILRLAAFLAGWSASG